jgi:hypothetical protein
MKQTIVLDSRYRINPEVTDGSIYKFRTSTHLNFKSTVRMEQFIFQNSQYVFSDEKGTSTLNFTINNQETTVKFYGTFTTVDDFIKAFNKTMDDNQLPNIRISYNVFLNESQIQNTDQKVFTLSGKGFLDLLGYQDNLQGQMFYKNTNVPKLFNQDLIYITIPELGYYTSVIKGISGGTTMNYTFMVLSPPGFQITSTYNNTFENDFYTGVKSLDELSVIIRGPDGKAFVNNKGNASFIIILSF